MRNLIAAVGGLILGSTALAAPPEPHPDAMGRHRVGLSQFFGTVTSDPWVSRETMGLEVEVSIAEPVSLVGRTFFSPDLGSDDWRPITHRLIEMNKVSPDISKVVWLAEIGLRYDLVRSSDRRVRIPVGLGIGTVRTVDDLHALQAEEEPGALATEVEDHLAPTWHLGFFGRPVSWLELGAELSGFTYVETILGTTLEMKNTRTFEVRVGFLLGVRP